MTKTRDMVRIRALFPVYLDHPKLEKSERINDKGEKAQGKYDGNSEKIVGNSRTGPVFHFFSLPRVKLIRGRLVSNGLPTEKERERNKNGRKATLR